MNNYKSVFEKAWAEVAESKPAKISSPSDCVPLLAKYRNKKQEHFIVVLLNSAHQVQKVETITKGTINETLAHPREIFRTAIVNSCVSIVVAHNHPSGNLTPSSEDKFLTSRIKNCGEILGINLLDHIIVSKIGYFSFLEEGIF